MKIMVNLPENIYESIKNNNLEKVALLTVIKAIENGTPLPEECGRLIDADEYLLSEKPKGIADSVWKESHIYKSITKAPTVVGADKGAVRI